MKKLILFPALLFSTPVMACDGPYIRDYGVQTTIDFDLRQISSSSSDLEFKTDAVHASGDTKIMKDEGVEANTTNGFVDEGQGYSITLTATEMSASRVVVYVVDQSTKVWIDKCFIVETSGVPLTSAAVDAVLDDNTSEVTGVPGTGTVTFRTLVRALYQIFVHKYEQTNTEQRWYRSDGTTNWFEKDATDNGTTYSKDAAEVAD